MPRIDVTFEKAQRIANATYAFALKLSRQALDYRAGQTVDLVHPNPRYRDDAGNRRTFSIANAPGSGEILLATRVRGSALKRSLIETSPGTVLQAEGPYGAFTLPDSASTVVLLAGGIGVTPFRAMVEDARNRGLKHSITLIHSNRMPEEAPFLEELTGWSADTRKFTYIPTMTKPERSDVEWSGERRRVNPEAIADWRPEDAGTLLYYIAGPERFVQGSVQALRALGVGEERIRAEEFPGYVDASPANERSPSVGQASSEERS